jgi:hypothetical protein
MQSKIDELERKVSNLSKAVQLMIFEEGEALPKEEIKELKSRLKDYFSKKGEFVSLEELLKECSK